MGIIGVGRGVGFARGAGHVGMKVVALCDTWEEKLDEAGKKFPDVTTYTDYDRFLEHDMDAVVLANYCHQHAPFAIKALKAGKHVMSEVIACKTMAEAVALVRAVEKSKKIYMMAENYCFFVYNQEMRRLYRAGEIGEVQFAECEYNHPGASKYVNQLAPGIMHWRNWLPSTYYPTHALGPIMYITETRPVSVNGQAIARSPRDKETKHVRRNDAGSCILLRMDNGAMVHILGLALRGHSIWYRLHGTRGLMENLRTHGNQGKLRIVHEEWDMKKGDVREKIYQPEFPVRADLAAKAGHGGGDFYTSYFFARAIRIGKQPWLNVYRSLDMSVIAIQAWRSALSNGAPHEIPDFRKESARRKYVKDNWSPFPEDSGPGQPPSSIKGFIKPNTKQISAARRVWKEMGYEGD